MIVLLAAPAARAADGFYEDLLEDGILAADRGDAARAAKVLRLACFGLLDEPAMLARCLTHLALAQAQLDDQEAFRATVDRLARIEKRFRAYTRAEIADAARRLLASRGEELLTREGSDPATMFPPPVVMPQADAEPLEASVELPEASLELPDGGDPTVGEVDSEAPLELPSNGDAPAAADPPEILVEDLPPVAVETAPEPAAPEEDLSAVLARAQEVKLTADRGRILEELERLRPLVAEPSQNRELQHLAAELAYRLSLWQESRDHFERGGVDPDRPDLAFLFAVTLYETGDRERAAEVLESCLSQLDLNPFVDSYVEKILGSAPQ